MILMLLIVWEATVNRKQRTVELPLLACNYCSKLSQKNELSMSCLAHDVRIKKEPKFNYELID